MPDIGVWRMETGSFYAANEIAAHVDLIRNATRGEIAVPIRLRMEQRQRVANGQTKKFPVVAVELRGPTAGQLMAGTANLDALSSLPTADRPALTAGGDGRDWFAEIAATTDLDVLRHLYEEARQANAPTEVGAAITSRAAEISGAPAQGKASSADPDALWAQIVAAAPVDWTTTQLEEEFAAATDGTFPGSASAEELQAFLDRLVSTP